MNPDAHRENARVVMFGKMAAVRELCPVRLLPEHPCEAARFELRFTLEKVKYPAASNGVFVPTGHLPLRQSPNIHASMAAWLVARGNKEKKEKHEQPGQLARGE